MRICAFNDSNCVRHVQQILWILETASSPLSNVLLIKQCRRVSKSFINQSVIENKIDLEWATAESGITRNTKIQWKFMKSFQQLVEVIKMCFIASS